MAILDIVRYARRRVHALRGYDFHTPMDARVRTVCVGSPYGGWDIAVDYTQRGCNIFSIGIGQDITFDLGMIERYAAQIYAFDPTPKTIAWLATLKLPPEFKFYPIGLAHYDGEARFNLENPAWDAYSMTRPDELAKEVVHCKVARLSTLAQTVNCDKIDILKMDIEGEEYNATPELLKSGLRPAQLLVEIHYDHLMDMPMEQAKDLTNLIRDVGYKLFARSPYGRNFSFIHESILR